MKKENPGLKTCGMERRRNGERQQEEMFMGEYFGKDTWKLGFGMMRLPRDPETHEIDVETTKLMVDKFITAGGTYFDTAYVYPGSEVATRKALIERYDRRRYTIASKLNVRVAATAEEAKAQIYTTLERLGLSYVDYYLIHMTLVLYNPIVLNCLFHSLYH
jgi:predicted aldo/keto reductase-like oxidoreductase